jgi:RNA polymerase sigma-70 factor (ECF subfamily)
VERYQAEAMGHAFGILADRQDAEDALQEAFLKAYRALARFDGTRRFYPWFYTILRNCCLKLASQRSKRQTAFGGIPRIFETSTNGSSDDAVRLEEALQALPPESREIITLRHLDGLSYGELAQRIGIPAGTVMSRLFHARQQLREKLGGKP